MTEPAQTNSTSTQSGAKVAVTGSTGLVGTALRDSFLADGIASLPIVRRATFQEAPSVIWDPATGLKDPSSLNGVDTVVHLAGDNIASGRWTAAKKQRIRDSRVTGTSTLCDGLASLDNPPKVLVAASAIGFYGDRGGEELTETSPSGTGFLPDVCSEWEDATLRAAEAGIRVVNVRIGVVLSRNGGALQKMLLPFQLGLGGIVGNGRQYWSWISLDDLVRVIRYCIDTPALVGPVNAVAPTPATNREFTKTLGRVLRRPTLFPLPAFAAKLVLGQMANDLLLASACVLPQRLTETGFAWDHDTLEAALRAMLER